MKNKIVLSSGYYPKEEIIPIVSPIHQILFEYGTPIKKEELSYRLINCSDVEECLRLEEEWFPFEPDSWLYEKSLSSKNYFTLACFWTHPSTRVEHMVGNIVFYQSYQSGYLKCFGPRMELDLPREIKQKYLKDNIGKSIAYICSIGVIDEARRFGVGSHLMEEGKNIALERWPNLMGVGLHVLETNSSAVRFYEKNNFIHLFTYPEYYEIRDKKENGRFYGKVINSEPNEKKVEKMTIIELCNWYTASIYKETESMWRNLQIGIHCIENLLLSS